MKVVICFALMVAGCLAMPADSGEAYEQRIIGGDAAQLGQFPYVVSIRNSNSNKNFCGGSLLNGNTVLTAAHCVQGQRPRDMIVVAGTNTLSNGGTVIPVSRLITHAGYNPETNVNDVAIIKLLSTFTMSPLIKSISLRGTRVQPQETLIFCGWGLTSYPGSIPNDLQWITLKSLDLQTCAAQLQGFYPIDKGHVCTTSPVNQGGCVGDSGGPLVDTTGKQVGIVSWGIPCAKGLPDVFTSVAFHQSWINKYL